jgi:hypothetical protein
VEKAIAPSARSRVDGLDRDLLGLLVRLAMEYRRLRPFSVSREDILDSDLPGVLAILATERRRLRPSPVPREEIGIACFGR